jgi:hypothetical protein
MFYRLLGILVWNGAKAILRQKYGRTYMPKRVWAGAALTGVGVALIVARNHSSDD